MSTFLMKAKEDNQPDINCVHLLEYYFCTGIGLDTTEPVPVHTGSYTSEGIKQP
jgi:hypothetical protein